LANSEETSAYVEHTRMLAKVSADHHQKELARLIEIIGRGPITQSPAQVSATAKRSTRRSKPHLQKRRKMICEISDLLVEGPKYCAEMDKRSVPPPREWLDEGWPRSYSQAYKDTKWRKRINDEKYRMTKK